MVLNGEVYAAALPRVIEAVSVPAGCGLDTRHCQRPALLCTPPFFRLHAVVDGCRQVFFPVHGTVHHREGSEEAARDAHARFVRRYPGAEVPPLLTFDVQLARRRTAPFREVW